MSVNTDGKTFGRGFELSIKQQLESKLNWYANFTYTKSQISDPVNPDQDGAEVPFVPKMMANAGFTFFLPLHFEVSPWLHYSGHIYDSSSFTDRNVFESNELLNIVVSKSFRFTGNATLKSFIRAYNITNNKYEMPWQFRDPGFTLNFGASILF